MANYRKPRHLSPTSFSLWENDKEQFYRQYLSEKRFEREPQTLPMAIGSAFDFLVKEHLYAVLGPKLLNKVTMTPQIESHNLPQAMVLGAAVMDAYEKSGALSALKAEIVSDARFEFGITGVFEDRKLVGNSERGEGDNRLHLNGRPDGHYYTKARFDSVAVPVIHDWKVNGWLSSSKSPDPGYISLHVEGRVTPHHKDAFISYHEGIKVNKGAVNPSWSTQLAIYAWVMGVPVGNVILGSIDQIIGPSDKPRVAKQRFLIRSDFQFDLFRRVLSCWEIINSEHIFRDLSLEASKLRCTALESVEEPEDWEKDFRER